MQSSNKIIRYYKDYNNYKIWYLIKKYNNKIKKHNN